MASAAQLLCIIEKHAHDHERILKTEIVISEGKKVKRMIQHEDGHLC